MKKLLLSSIALLAFSLSIIVFQISCKKEIKAQNDTIVKQLGKILYRDKATGDYYLANYDGTGKQKLNIALPSGYSMANRVHLSPDGKKMFAIHSANNGGYGVYSYDIDGSNMKKVVEVDDNDDLGVY